MKKRRGVIFHLEYVVESNGNESMSHGANGITELEGLRKLKRTLRTVIKDIETLETKK